MIDLLTWVLAPDLGRDKLALLVLCCASIYILAANLAWRLQPGRSWFTRALVQVLRLVYYVGIPGTVLWRGALVEQIGIPTTYLDSGGMLGLGIQFLGLGNAEQLAQLGRGVAWSAGGLCVLIVLWVWYARAVPGARITPSSRPLWSALWEAILLQAQWTFYRSVVLLFTGNRLHSAFLSLALITLSWLLSPQRRHDLFTGRGHRVVEDWVCALLTSLLTLSVSLPWLSVAAHTLWLWVGNRVLVRGLSAQPLNAQDRASHRGYATNHQ